MNHFFNKVILLLCTFAITLAASAQVTVETKIDEPQMLIGQRMGVTLEVTADAGTNVELPQLDSMQEIDPGLEFVKRDNIDTTYINDGKRMTLKSRYYFTAFDSAVYLIQLPVRVDTTEYLPNKLALKVLNCEIDTLQIDKIAGMKSVLNPPFDWDEWKGVIYSSLIVLVLAGIMAYVYYRIKNNKPIIRRIRNKKQLPPHKVAMQKIETIKEEKIWQSEDSKEYYTQLTDALRQYIKDRYGFNATEMTSYEIIQKLQEVNDDEAINELRELFQTADLVKFAKYSTLANENDRNLVNAIAYIDQTKQEEVEQAPQPEVVIVEEKSSKLRKYILWTSITVVSIAILAVLAYIGYRIYMITL